MSGSYPIGQGGRVSLSGFPGSFPYIEAKAWLGGQEDDAFDETIERLVVVVEMTDPKEIVRGLFLDIESIGPSFDLLALVHRTLESVVIHEDPDIDAHDAFRYRNAFRALLSFRSLVASVLAASIAWPASDFFDALSSRRRAFLSSLVASDH